MAKATAETIGLRRLERKVKKQLKIPDNPHVRVSFGYQDDGTANVIIARKEALRGRSPFFITDAEHRQYISLLEAEIDQVQERGSQALKKILTKIGRAIIKNYKRHIKSKSNEKGKFRPLSLVYAARKKKKHPGKGPLVATGTLRKSMKAKTIIARR